MSYVKWVGNVNRHTDWTSRLELEDGTVVERGVPVELSADVRKKLEEQGRIFEDSSKSEADQVAEQKPVVGADAAISGPVFGGGTDFNQKQDDSAGDGEQKSGSKKN